MATRRSTRRNSKKNYPSQKSALRLRIADPTVSKVSAMLARHLMRGVHKMGTVKATGIAEGGRRSLTKAKNRQNATTWIDE
jgi:hypothetical protein